MRCPSCGERISRSDETCPFCNTLLRFEEPRGTLQDPGPRFRWTSRHTRLLIILIIVTVVIIGVSMLIYFLLTFEGFTFTSGSLHITDYRTGGLQDRVWFAIDVSNPGSTSASGNLEAMVTTDSGTFTNNSGVSCSGHSVTTVYMFVEVPPGEGLSYGEATCYF